MSRSTHYGSEFGIITEFARSGSGRLMRCQIGRIVRPANPELATWKIGIADAVLVKGATKLAQKVGGLVISYHQGFLTNAQLGLAIDAAIAAECPALVSEFRAGKAA